MSFHIVITDEEDNRVLTDFHTNAIATVYNSDEGVHAESMMNCNGRTLLKLALSLDELRDHILQKDPIAAIMYLMKEKIIDSAVEIDIGAIKRAMMEREKHGEE